MGDEFWVKQLAEKRVLGPVLDLLLRTVPRDNLVCSACLDLFGHVAKEGGVKYLIKHLVENYREKIQALSAIDTFSGMLARYEQMQEFERHVDPYFLDSEDEVGRRPPNVGRAMMEHLVVDSAQEDYWNCSDDEEETQPGKGGSIQLPSSDQIRSKMLVEYSSDDEAEENGDAIMTSSGPAMPHEAAKDNDDPVCRNPVLVSNGAVKAPPERVSDKRRREEEDEDEMDKLMQHKRRNSSSASINNIGAAAAMGKKKGLVDSLDASSNAPKRISISISPSLKAAGGKGAANGESSPRGH